MQHCNWQEAKILKVHEINVEVIKILTVELPKVESLIYIYIWMTRNLVIQEAFASVSAAETEAVDSHTEMF